MCNNVFKKSTYDSVTEPCWVVQCVGGCTSRHTALYRCVCVRGMYIESANLTATTGMQCKIIFACEKRLAELCILFNTSIPSALSVCDIYVKVRVFMFVHLVLLRSNRS